MSWLQIYINVLNGILSLSISLMTSEADNLMSAHYSKLKPSTPPNFQKKHPKQSNFWLFWSLYQKRLWRFFSVLVYIAVRIHCLITMFIFNIPNLQRLKLYFSCFFWCYVYDKHFLSVVLVRGKSRAVWRSENPGVLLVIRWA